MSIDHFSIERYLGELKRIADEVSRADIQKVIDILMDAWRNDGTVFMMGNGGSASTATHFAADLAKGTIVAGQKRFKTICLDDNIPLVSAWTNDAGFGSIFAEQLEPWLKQGDVLVGLSVHGGSGSGDAGPWSQNILQAVKLAKVRNAKVVGFSGFGGGSLKDMADVCVVVPIESEPLGTALVESVHVALHHLVCVALREKIQELANSHD